MRVILTHNITDDARRLHVLFVWRITTFTHGIENPAMHRLQTIARIWKSPRYDHAHRIVQIGGLELVLDRDWRDALYVDNHCLLDCLRAVGFNRICAVCFWGIGQRVSRLLLIRVVAIRTQPWSPTLAFACAQVQTSCMQLPPFDDRRCGQ